MAAFLPSLLPFPCFLAFWIAGYGVLRTAVVSWPHFFDEEGAAALLEGLGGESVKSMSEWRTAVDGSARQNEPAVLLFVQPSSAALPGWTASVCATAPAAAALLTRVTCCCC